MMKKWYRVIAVSSAVLLVVVVVSWFAFPGWQQRPNGLLELIGVAAVPVVSIVAAFWGMAKEEKHIDTGGGAVIQNNQAQQIIGRDQWNIYLSGIGRGRLNEEEFEKVLRNYLEWVRNSYSKARLWGLESLQVSGERPVRSLSDVFVPLSLCRFRPPQAEEVEKQTGGDANAQERIRAYLRLVEERQREGQDVALNSLLRLKDRLAVIGGPGCGKSTLLSYLACNLAEAALTGNRPPFDLPEGRRSLLPVVVTLREYGLYQQRCKQAPEHSAGNPHAGTLMGFILDTLQKQSGMHLAEDFFERMLLGGGCLVMLDGLDEVVSREERGKVRQQIERLATGYPKNCILVTAREAGYQQDAVFGDDFLRLDVKLLKGEAIADLVGKWCRLLYPEAAEKNQQDILRAIGEMNERSVKRALQPLVSTPLMVTMVVGVKWGKTELPRERAKLYEAAVEVILQAQYTPQDDARKQLVDWGGPWEEQREWLMELAYRMHSSGEGGAAVSEEVVRSILGRVLAAEKVQRFLEAVRSRGGLFEERAESFQFLHLSFQEFLAARWIVKQREKGWVELEGRLVDSWWREVLLLSHGFALRDHRPFAEQYLNWLSQGRDDGEQHLGGLELAGSALLEMESPQEEAKQACAARIVEVLKKADLLAPAPLRARAGDCTDRLGYAPEDLGSLVAIRDEEGRVLFRIGKYPVTNGEYRAFLESGQFAEERYWVGQLRFDARSQMDGDWGERGLAWLREAQRDQDDSPDGGVVYPRWWRDPRFGMRRLGAPVMGMTWWEANAYCRWRSEQLGWGLEGLRLPTEAEWLRAAGGDRPEGRYPWDEKGKETEAKEAILKRANAANAVGRTTVVWQYPLGATEGGVWDLAGNVWEWQANLYKDDRDWFALRGGSWYSNEGNVRCAVRARYASGVFDNVGFRLFSP